MKDFNSASAKQITSALLVGFMSLLFHVEVAAATSTADRFGPAPSNFLEAPCAGVPEWSSTEVYTGGKEAVVDNVLYRAKWWTRGENPAAKSGQFDVWEAVGPCDGGDGGGGGSDDNVAPTASITGPANNAAFDNGADIDITADAADSDGTVATVEFFSNGERLGEDTTSPYSFTVTGAAGGTYSLTVRATDDAGASTTSAAVSVTVGAGDDDGGDGGDGGDDCEGVAQFVVGSAYGQDESVFNEGTIYTCNIPGWCSSTAGWAYAPGTGTYWEDAWTANGDCDNGGGGGGGDDNASPTVSISSPSDGAGFREGDDIDVTASAADSDGTVAKVAFFNNGSLVSEDTGAPYRATVSNAPAGSYTLTAVATDDDGATTTSAEVRITVTGDNPNPPNPPNPPTSGLPGRILNGYWHNFDNGSGITRLRDVSPNWDVINVSFAVPSVSVSEGTIGFELDGAFSALNYGEADFKSDIRLLQSRGKKVIISIGGAEGQVRLTTAGAASRFTTSMTAIINEYGFNGMDIDFEGQSLSFDRGDTDFRNPTTPLIVNTINGIRGVTDNFGDDFILTMAPETFFVQLGYSFYGGISTFADARAGSYLPVIHALRDKLTFLQVQYYNSGSITALDDNAYAMGNSDFYVSLVDMLLKGFPITGDAGKFFPPLREDQILIGVPATVNAGGGFTGAQGVTTALNYLIRGNSFGGQYTLDRTYPNLRGVMSWSTNWDEFGDLQFSNAVRAYLDGLPAPTSLSARDNEVAAGTPSSFAAQVFPNPVSGSSVTVQLEAKTASPEFRMQVSNVLGANVLEYADESLRKGANAVTIDLGDLRPGLYIYSVTTQDGRATGELVVE